MDKTSHDQNVQKFSRGHQINCTWRAEPSERKSDTGDEAAPGSRFFPLFLGILSIFLLACIIIIIRISVVMYVQDANLSELKLKMKTMETQTEELSRERDDLSWTLAVILSFDNFPVKEICPNKKCASCQKNWVQFQRKCYFFSNDGVVWKTWQESRQFCQNVSADLVVIDNQQEQEFISERVRPYYDMYHGYWIGLEKKGNEWVWIDGQRNTLEFQAGEQFPFGGRRGLLVPGKNVQQNLIKADAFFKNKFICETGALIMTRSF